ncbi:MAG TPA: ABC transporter ATP-binding protein [Acidobacteriota bacterium]|nr:ABC transporter ATP-binding protein [Acidobacteriota bacterium]
MTNFHEEEVLGKAYDGRLARRLLTYLRPYRWPVTLSVLLLIVVSALRLVGPLLVVIAIDGYIQAGDLDGLLWIAILFLSVLLFQFLVSYAQTYLTNWTGQKIMYDLRTEIFAHLQKLHVGFFDRTPVGRLITRLTNDVDALNELFTSGVVSIFGDVVSLAGIVIALLYLDWRLALITFSVIPLLFIATMIFKAKVRGSYRRVRTTLARMNSFLQENIVGMSVVQLFTQEDRQYQRFQRRNQDHLEANLDSILYYAVYYPVINLIGALSIALIVWYGGLRHLDGTLTLGVLVAFIQYSERFYKPISDLSEKFNILQSAMASSERIFKLLDTAPQILRDASPARLSEIQGAVEFRGVDFAYDSSAPVLKNINLKISAGEKVAVVGATGAGKTTLINLLCRFYDTVGGSVRIDGVDVRRMDLEQLRQAVAVVLQDVFLFSGTIEENIRLWRRPVPPHSVRAAAEQVHAHRFIEDLPEGYAAQVAERGSSLSVGQRQLLAFARALAHDPKILILDEATSSVDTETEMLIQDALQRLLADRTAIVIAHRLSTIQNCDRIVVLHKGEIHEEGTHQQLLRQKGIYFRLYQLQYKEHLLARISHTGS